jgi:hypothetical protein
MADSLSYPGLITALLLPWLAGCVGVRSLLAGSGRWNWCVVAGHGYFVGAFVTTLLIRGWHVLGLNLHFWPIAAVLLALTAAAGAARFGKWHGDGQPSGSTAIPRWHTAVITLLVCLVAWRYWTLLQEVSMRPLFAWDAWMNWAPKAIVWFHHSALVPFVAPAQWLQQGVTDSAYTLGNWQASLYPPTVPLIQLWSMLGAGTSDDSYLYFPWVLAPLALGLALYGHLRLAGTSALAATVACYLLLNLPYLNVHTALAGYADLWLASAFGLAMFALHEWRLNRGLPYLALCLFMACLCSQLKNPGIVLALIIVTAVLRSWLNLSARTEILLSLILAVALVSALAFGVGVDIPNLGRLSLNFREIEIPYFGRFPLAFHPVSGAFGESLFLAINWNLLGYLLILFILAKLVRGDMARQPSPESFVLIASMLFIAFVFYFTRHYYAALSFVTLNRALLYPVAALIFYLFLHTRSGPDTSPGPRPGSGKN